MGFLGWAVIAVATLYGLSLSKTASAAANLMYDLKKVQIHKIDGNGITFGLLVNFTNTKNSAVIIQMLSLAIYLDGQKLGIVQASNIEIPANSFSDKKIYITMSWQKLLLAIGERANDWWNNRTIAPPTQCRIEGQIKAENYTLTVNKTIPFSSTIG